MNCPCCGSENKYTTLYCIICGEELKNKIPKKTVNKKASFPFTEWECIKTTETPDPKNMNNTEIQSLSLHYYGEILAILRTNGDLEIKRLDRDEQYTLNNSTDNYRVLSVVFPVSIIDSTMSMVESVPYKMRNLFPDSILELYKQEKELESMKKSSGAAKNELLTFPANRLISLDSDGKVRIRDFMERKTIREIKFTISQNSRLALSPDNKKIAVTNNNIEIKDISSEIPKMVACKSTFHVFPSVIRYFPDGQTILSASSARIGVWNTSDGELVRTLTMNEFPISSLSFSGKGLKFVSGDEKGGLVVWDGVTLSFTRSLGSNIGGKAPGRINDICFIPGTDYFFTASENRIIILWKIDEDMRICSLEGHKGPVTALCMSRDGKTLISGDKSGEIKFWKPVGLKSD